MSYLTTSGWAGAGGGAPRLFPCKPQFNGRWGTLGASGEALVFGLPRVWLLTYLPGPKILTEELC